jgi:serine/threonine protein phosphatase PrpC
VKSLLKSLGTSELQSLLDRLTFPSLQVRFSSTSTGRSTLHHLRPPTVVGLTDVGRTRPRNEDSICLLPELGVAVVADGMGGHPGGDVASRIAADTAGRVLSNALEGLGGGRERPRSLRAAMTKAVAHAHIAVRERGFEAPELSGMGTTLTAIAVDAESGRWVVGHVGDSRAYMYRGGRLEQLTRDDTWVQERLDAGQLTLEQARNHPFSHMLTQCIGLDTPPKPLIVEGETTEGDTYLLCTDGLVGMLDDDDLVAVLDRAGSADREDAPVRALLEAANDAGGFDNITAALVTVRGR